MRRKSKEQREGYYYKKKCKKEAADRNQIEGKFGQDKMDIISIKSDQSSRNFRKLDSCHFLYHEFDKLPENQKIWRHFFDPYFKILP